jgi:hypothetical protein
MVIFVLSSRQKKQSENSSCLRSIFHKTSVLNNYLLNIAIIDLEKLHMIKMDNACLEELERTKRQIDSGFI